MVFRLILDAMTVRQPQFAVMRIVVGDFIQTQENLKDELAKLLEGGMRTIGISKGLKLRVDKDGHWLEFKAGGRCEAIRLEARSDSSVDKIMLVWAKELVERLDSMKKYTGNG